MKSLYAHQRRFLARDPDKAMLVWSMGSGKTRVACEWAKKRGPVLIICPKGLRENWRRECEMWGLKDYQIISKEEFKKHARELSQKVIICDEADAFFSANFKSQLSKALHWYIKEHNPNLLLASGTPLRSSAWNIYTAATLLGHAWNYRDFQYRFFSQIQMGFRLVPVPRAGTEEELRELIESISDVFRLEDEFDVPPQIDETIYTGESKAQKNAHEDNVEIAPIVRFTRDHQIEAGIGLPEKDDTKLELIQQYALDVPKVAVVCRYRAQLEAYAVALRREGHTVYEMHGDVQNRSETLDRVENEKRCVLLCQSATCEGFEAPSIGLMVFASLDYSYRNYIQMKGRILRVNRLKKNIYIHLIAGEADKAVMTAIGKKQDFDVLKYYKDAGKKDNARDT